jgi:hypothetical protein
MGSRNFYFFPCVILITGLVISQIIFSVVVYCSNLSLYSHLSSIRDAGYLIVPNQYIVNTLKNFAPAFYGGLFFSLTTGSGITWMTLALMLIWRAFNCRGMAFFPLLAIWVALIAIANKNGFNLGMFSALIIIPLAVAYAVFIVLGKKGDPSYWKMFLAHIIVLILICASWFPHLNADTFISVRDYLLLGNSLGQKANNFYYTYTMYPAEAFKTVDQKILKTCILDIGDLQLRDAIENKLRNMDYLAIAAELIPDVSVVEENQRLVFVHNQKKVMESSVRVFLSDPDKIMSNFSSLCDNSFFLRKITFFSLILGFPISVYILLHSAVMMALFFISSPKWRFGISSLLCLAIGMSAAIPLYHDYSRPISESDIAKHLQSKDWRTRTAALKKISDDGLGIDRFLDDIPCAEFTHIPEKYWFVQALSQSRNNHTIDMLNDTLKDPNPNIVCMALYSLGKRNHRQSIGQILGLINTSRHWYVQWYAYKALRRMGWTQPKLL